MAASIRRVCQCCLQKCFQTRLWQTKPFPGHIIRSYKNWVPAVYAQLYRRRLLAGPEPDRHRSEWINWNYDAEIYAFGKRLGEEFQDDTLRQALTHRSYIEKEEKRREDLGIDAESVPLGIQDNEEFIAIGEETMHVYIKSYLRHVYPRLFEEAISSVYEYLSSVQVLSHIARHIGLTDIVLCQDFPVEDETLSKSFLSIVGAIEHDQGRDNACTFLRDFVIPQLVEKDINDLWTVSNPMGLLTNMLSKQGLSAPEPRLQWSSASRTMMAVYQVGIYCDQRLIGQSPGETPELAEEMAARDAIKRMLGLSDSRNSLPLGATAQNLQIDFGRVNPRISEDMAG